MSGIAEARRLDAARQWELAARCYENALNTHLPSDPIWEEAFVNLLVLYWAYNDAAHAWSASWTQAFSEHDLDMQRAMMEQDKPIDSARIDAWCHYIPYIDGHSELGEEALVELGSTIPEAQLEHWFFGCRYGDYAEGVLASVRPHVHRARQAPQVARLRYLLSHTQLTQP